MMPGNDSTPDAAAPSRPGYGRPRPRQIQLPVTEKNASHLLSGPATVPMRLPRQNVSMCIPSTPVSIGRIPGSGMPTSITQCPPSLTSSGLPTPWSPAWAAQPRQSSGPTPCAWPRALSSADQDFVVRSHTTSSMLPAAGDSNTHPHARPAMYAARSKYNTSRELSSARSTPEMRQEWYSTSASLAMSLGARLGSQSPLDSSSAKNSSLEPDQSSSTLLEEEDEDVNSVHRDTLEEADTLRFPPAWSRDLSGLHGVGGGTLLGARVRKKITDTLLTLVKRDPHTPLSPGRSVQIVEYGAVHGRGYPLMQAIIARLAEAATEEQSLPLTEQEAAVADEGLSFSVLHCDAPGADFRGLMFSLSHDPESYLAPGWAQKTPGVSNDGVYHSVTARPFGARVAPRGSIDFGVSLMDLHWGHTPTTVGAAAAADAELSVFLRARATELRPGSQLVVAYMARGADGMLSSPRQATVSSSRAASGQYSTSRVPSFVQEPARDVWSVLTEILTPTLQWLVSCGMLSGDVARHMLVLPMYPRTAAESLATLRRLGGAWKIDWSCGLGQHPGADETHALNEPDPIRVTHPAWVSYNAGALSRVAYCEHVIALIKQLYEEHWRKILSTRGRLSKGGVAYILDMISDVLQSRLDSPEVQLRRLDFEICIYTLRRKQ